MFWLYGTQAPSTVSTGNACRNQQGAPCRVGEKSISTRRMVWYGADIFVIIMNAYLI